MTAKAEGGQTLDEWLEEEIDKFKDLRGQITGIYSNMPKTNWLYGTFSWHDLEIQELLAVLQGMKVQSDSMLALRNEIHALLGLPDEAPKEEVKKAMDEIREFMAEMRRVYGGRSQRDDSVQGR